MKHALERCPHGGDAAHLSIAPFPHCVTSPGVRHTFLQKSEVYSCMTGASIMTGALRSHTRQVSYNRVKGKTKTGCASGQRRASRMEHDIIVIGVSAGGIKALRTLVAGLPHNLKASLFIVMHIPASPSSALPQILSRAGPLSALHPAEGTVIEQGKIYVAPPDYHLIIEEGYLHLGTGPKEHYVRPAVNVLFRSAAQSYGPHVVGVVLTGFGQDGADGLLTIKRHGGVAVIQDPHDAPFPFMPQSALALAHNHVDYVIPLSNMAPLLIGLVSSSL